MKLVQTMFPRAPRLALKYGSTLAP